MDKKLSKVKVLKALDIADARHMTKDKAMFFASMFRDMDPEVKKKVLEQFPELAKMPLEALQDCKGIIEKTQDNASASSKQCIELYNEVIQALKTCLSKKKLPFEEKKYYVEKMMEIAKMADEKDTENKRFYWGVIATGAAVVISVIIFGSPFFGCHYNANSLGKFIIYSLFFDHGSSCTAPAS